MEPAVLLRVGGVSEMNKLHPACALPLDQSSVTIYDYEPSLADFKPYISFVIRHSPDSGVFAAKDRVSDQLGQG